MDYEWDEQKAETNLKKHGVSFRAASLIFDHPVLDRVDDRFDYREERRIAIGMSSTSLLSVIYTLRGSNLRLISARKANRYEREAYRKLYTGGA